MHEVGSCGEHPSLVAFSFATSMELPQYRVSTITAVGSVNTCLNLSNLLCKFPLGRTSDEGPSFVSTKMGEVKRTWMDHDDDLVSAAGSKTRDCFGNQVTLVIEMEGTKLNLKAFKNGSVQLTGVKNIDQGFRAIQHFVSELKKEPSISSDPDKLVAGGYRVCMINSDFDLGFPIKRDRLFSFVRKTYPDVLCTYEPCNYHGVKFKYMWNESKERKGICRCKGGFCVGNSDGKGDGRCRKVTVAVFQSGKVIATGAQTIQQLEDAIRFLVEAVCSKENKECFQLVEPQLKG